MPHICYSSSATVTTKCDRGARGMMSAEGASQGNNERVCVGGRGAAHAATPALPVEVQGGRPHRLCRFPTAANICDHGATRGTTSAEGGGGPPSPQYRRTPSTRGPSTPLCHSSSATAATERDRGARGTMSAGGGEGLPTLHRQGHLLMHGPSTPPLPLLLGNNSNHTRHAGHRPGVSGNRTR